MLAQVLAGGPSLLVAVNPTRGLDVAMTEEIARHLCCATRAYLAVLNDAAGLDELIETADRVVLVFEGCDRGVAARNPDVVRHALLGAT
jgi:simple sugar transport system ATP-binding protein